MTPQEMLAQQLLAQQQNGGAPPANPGTEPWNDPSLLPPATTPPPQPETAPLLQRLLEALGMGGAPAAPTIGTTPIPTLDPNSPEGIAEALRKRNEGMSQFAPPSGSTGLP